MPVEGYKISVNGDDIGVMYVDSDGFIFEFRVWEGMPVGPGVAHAAIALQRAILSYLGRLPDERIDNEDF